MRTYAERLQRAVSERERVGHTSATVERLLKAGEDAIETTPPSREAPGGVQRVTEAPLDRLHRAGEILEHEFNAGDRFRADAYLAAIDPGAKTVDWNAAGGGGFSAKVPIMFSSQNMADARIRHRRIKERVHGVIWTVAELALIKELPFVAMGQSVFGRGDPRDAAVAGKTAVRMMLAALADAYVAMEGRG